MAIRRVSDLPDLTTIYRTDFETQAASLSNFGKCLLEVSYDHIGSIYQSFSTKASDIFKTLCAALSVDTSNLVTVNGDQTITGRKVFNNSHGIVISANSNFATEIKGITQLSTHILNSNTQLIPSPKAVHDYISASCLPIDALGDLTSLPDTVEMLKSLVTAENGYYFVKHDQATSGTLSSDRDGTFDHPFFTIDEAITKINKRRFVQNAEAYIYLLCDYVPVNGYNDTVFYNNSTDRKPNQINIYHPDMVQNRKIYICGWEQDRAAQEGELPPSKPGQIQQRLLSVDATNCGSHDSWFLCRCNIRFKNCTFNNNIPITYSNNNQITTTNNIFYTIGGTNNVGAIDLNYCKFEHCYYAVHANIANTMGCNCFLSCIEAFDMANPGSSRSSLGGTIYCADCNIFAKARINSTIRFSSGEDDSTSYLMLAIANSAFAVSECGVVLTNFPTYQTLSSAENKCVWVSHLSSTSNGGEYQRVTQPPNSSTVELSVISCLTGRTAQDPGLNGYDNNGYMQIDAKINVLSGCLSRECNITGNKLSNYISSDTTGIYTELVFNNRYDWPVSFTISN